MLSGPPGYAGLVPDCLSGTQVSATSEPGQAVEVCAHQLAEGYGCSKAGPLELDGRPNRYEQSARVSVTVASEFLEPVTVGRFE